MMKEAAWGEELKRKRDAWKRTQSKHAPRVWKWETRGQAICGKQETFSNRLNRNSGLLKLQRGSMLKKPKPGFRLNGFLSLSLLASLVSIWSAVGEGLVICTGTAVLKPKNNPQSAVHCEQSAPVAVEQPSGGNLPKVSSRFTHGIKEAQIQSGGTRRIRSATRNNRF